MRSLAQKILVIVLSTLVALQGFAAPLCQDVFLTRTEEHIKDLAAKYPDLAFPLAEPEKFMAEMNDRFQGAKKRDPKKPLEFDFREIGLPALRSMRDMVPQKIADLEKWKGILRTEGILPFWVPASFLKFVPAKFSRAQGEKMIKQIEIGQQYLRELDAEIKTHLESGTVTYFETLELSYFFTRAIGHFDRFAYNYKYKLLMLSEYLLQGYRDLDMETEIKMYHDRDFRLYQQSSKHRFTQAALEDLEKAFVNQDKLEFVLIPTSLSLNLDVFYRLQPQFIYPVGITDQPINADGVRRHGGLFYQHDVGHSAFMFQGAKWQEKEAGEKNFAAVRDQMMKWQVELNDEIAKIEDPELRAVVAHLSFNIHHERGYPFVPSTFEKMPKAPPTCYALFFLFGFTGQMKAMGPKPYTHVSAAWTWLREFWKQREGAL